MIDRPTPRLPRSSTELTPTGSTLTRGGPLRVLGWLLSGLGGALAMGFIGASGCGDTIDSKGQSEALGEARQAESSAVTCVTLQRGLSKAFDAMISSEKGDNNYGASTVALVGPASGSGVDRFHALFRFDISSIPVNATITSATVALSQIAATPGTWNAHLITAPWDEATVTWNSFAGAFNATTFKSANTATQSVVFNIAPQLQAWVNGSVPNLGFMIERPGVTQAKIKTQEFVLANGRPFIAACYKVTCAPHFADCDGNAQNGCEADLQSPATCGACNAPCALPHATASCAAGACAVGSCDLGFGDCDGDPQNGCETSLGTSTDCGACGVPCALSNAAASCAGGACKLLSCDAGTFDCDGNPQNGCEATPCGDGAHCAGSSGCVSQICVGGFCASPACNDHAQNGSETDLDCGGACPPCADGASCDAPGDCQSAVCDTGACAAPACTDGVKNGSESDVDCGGGCAPCADDAICAAGADCQSGVCLGGACHAAACTDGLKNGAETGVDCGGSCAPCGGGVGCLVAGDCASQVCSAGVCQIPSCADGVKNGAETDVDCGGSCPDCNDNQVCAGPGDCANGVCAAGHCQPPTCADGVKNGDETDVDCGGACTVPETCNGVDDDCDGSTDEDLGTLTCGIGACQVTVPSCLGGASQACVPGVPAAQEACDGQLDDDCDGVVDDGCACVNGATQGCYTGSGATQNQGLCHSGTQTCALGQWGACIGQVTPSAEACDSADNDCDGQTDEELGSVVCGVGACQVTVQKCVGGAAPACVPAAPSTEICDGLDNDCNGQVDEGLPTLTCGVGACSSTVPSCVNGAPSACDPHATDGSSCNDNHDCTGNDICSNGRLRREQPAREHGVPRLHRGLRPRRDLHGVGPGLPGERALRRRHGLPRRRERVRPPGGLHRRRRDLPERQREVERHRLLERRHLLHRRPLQRQRGRPRLRAHAQPRLPGQPRHLLPRHPQRRRLGRQRALLRRPGRRRRHRPLPGLLRDERRRRRLDAGHARAIREQRLPRFLLHLLDRPDAAQQRLEHQPHAGPGREIRQLHRRHRDEHPRLPAQHRDRGLRLQVLRLRRREDPARPLRRHADRLGRLGQGPLLHRGHPLHLAHHVGPQHRRALDRQLLRARRPQRGR